MCYSAAAPCSNTLSSHHLLSRCWCLAVDADQLLHNSNMCCICAVVDLVELLPIVHLHCNSLSIYCYCNCNICNWKTSKILNQLWSIWCICHLSLWLLLVPVLSLRHLHCCWLCTVPPALLPTLHCAPWHLTATRLCICHSGIYLHLLSLIHPTSEHYGLL